VVFAAAITPYMLQGDDNPAGPLTKKKAATMAKDLTADEDSFYDEFTTQFFSVDGQLGSPRRSARRRSPCATKPTRR